MLGPTRLGALLCMLGTALVVATASGPEKTRAATGQASPQDIGNSYRCVSTRGDPGAQPIADAAHNRATPREYSDLPELRAELGRHSGKITDISEDETGHLAVTGSWDKTVRVWALPD